MGQGQHSPGQFRAFLLVPSGTVLSAAADSSGRFIVPIDDRFSSPLFSGMCGLPVEIHIEGQLIVAPGKAFAAEANYTATYTNLQSGRSVLLQRTSGRRIVEFDAQTGLLRLTNQGATRLVVPGQGAIEVAAADTLLLDPLTGDGVSHEVHGRDTSVDVVALICALLSG